MTDAPLPERRRSPVSLVLLGATGLLALGLLGLLVVIAQQRATNAEVEDRIVEVGLELVSLEREAAELDAVTDELLELEDQGGR